MTSHARSFGKTKWLYSAPPTPVFGDFPYIRLVGCDDIYNADYSWEGKNRPDHPHYILQFTLNGQGCFLKNEREITVNPGEVFLCYSHDPTIGYKYPARGTQTWEVVYIGFHGAATWIQTMTEALGHVYRFDPESPIFNKILDFAHRDPETTPISFQENTQLISGILAALAEKGASIPTDVLCQNSSIQLAVNFIHSRVHHGCSVQEVAEFIHLSPEHFCRLFKADLGESPSHYIRKVRMHHAAELLEGTFLSVKEIATRLHFDTGSNFGRCFKQVFGVTPNAYRQKIP